MRIDVIHANASAAKPLHDIFETLDPSLEVHDHINEAMLREAEKDGVTPKALRMFANEVFQAAEEGTDGILIACSVYCGYAPLMKPFLSVPILAVDAPAVSRAAAEGTKIGILATTAPSAPACRKKLKEEAERIHKVLRFEEGIVTEAMNALKKGDMETHDRLLIEKAQKLMDSGCDILFLSQVTMARVYVSMPEAMKQITLSTADSGAQTILRLARENKSA